MSGVVIDSTYGGWIAPGWPKSSANLKAWFNGDSYNPSTHAWTDLSGNGNNVALGAGSPVPTVTTLGGQAALDLSGGAWFENTATSLFATGATRTICVVGKGAAGGGTIMAFRRSAPSCDVQLYEYFGNTIALGDEATSNVIMPEIGPSYIGIPFASAHVLKGSGNVPDILIANVLQTVNTGHQADDSGTTGFMLGSNPGAQPWNGIVAEIIILAGTSTEEFFT